jgi:hypothetical protein
MPINTSGQVSLGGCVIGQSINREIGALGSAQVSMNDTIVRTLAGVASGQIVMPTNFYGKSLGPTTGIYYGGGTSTSTSTNLVTRINACGAIIGSETNVGTTRVSTAGAGMDTHAMFWAGFVGGPQNITWTNTAARINKCGALVGAETTPTSYINASLYQGAGTRVGANGLYFTPNQGVCSTTTLQRITRLNSSGALVGSSTITLSTRQRFYPGSATVGTNGMFYGGETFVDFDNCAGAYFFARNHVVRVNACAVKVGSCTTLGTARSKHTGATVGVNGLFYAGSLCSGAQTNTVTRINTCGALVGSQTTASTARAFTGGSRIGEVGVFYAGYFQTTRYNQAVRINACGALVGSVTTVGTARTELSGASV